MTKSGHSITVRNNTLQTDPPGVMGILNTTPDSFSDGGNFVSVDQAIDRIGEMVEQGATIIDVGGESTRPGSEPVADTEEMDRVLPVFERAIPAFPKTIFSSDTTKYAVAKAALEEGVHIINDVSGLSKEPRIAKLCADYQAGYVLMHSRGDPQTMQKNPVYDDVIDEISGFFKQQLTVLKHAGVESVIIDPGIGFGKTLQHNLQIVRELKNFLTFGYPILVGASRKSMIGQLLGNRNVNARLAGTLAVHYHCLMQGAGILRVHDVLEAVDSVRVYCALKGNKS